jgi:arylsulfatase A-like enzyme
MQNRPNIILIVMDSVRADRLSCYGWHRRSTPFLDSLAARGAIYEQAISPSFWTLPSLCSLFTGLYPSEHGAVKAGLVLADDIAPTMAEALREAGYHTIGLSNNPNISGATNLSRGFEVFDDAWRVARKARVWRVLARGHRVLGFGDDGAAATLRRAAALLKGPRRPFFLFLLFMDTHFPYFPHWRSSVGISLPLRSLAMWPVYARFARGGNWGALLRQRPHLTPLLSDLYEGELSCLDARLRRFFSEIGPVCDLENTVTIVTADHGEALGDHGKISHGASVYDSLGRVPLIASAPAFLPSGTRVTAQVQLTDIWPSLARHLGLPAPAGHWDGKRPDILSLDQMREGPWPAYMETSPEDGLTAIRANGWKYIVGPEGEEIYDLAQDPGELSNLARVQPARLAEMKESLARWREALRPYAGLPSTSDDEEFVARLKALGYM